MQSNKKDEQDELHNDIQQVACQEKLEKNRLCYVYQRTSRNMN